jgi:uncharacterized protein (TIGR01777 family)
LVRRTPGDGQTRWDPAAGHLDAAALDGADAVVNLSGAGIGDKRWTDSYRRELRDSRLKATNLLAGTIASMATPPAVFVSASAIGIYGARGDEELDERSSVGDDFLAQLCVDWEAAAQRAAAATRVVTIRTGIVQSPRGGSLKKQLPLFKLGLGSKFGTGKPWQSWISIDDEVGAIIHLLGADVQGPVNLTAPNPVTGAEFARTLGKVLRRPSFLSVPLFAPKIVLGDDLVDALLGSGQRVLPQRLLESGYTFQHSTLESALRALLL